MNPFHRPTGWRCELPSAAHVYFFLALCTLCFAFGCKKGSPVDDPQLKPVQDMLNQSVPNGSSEGMVNQFLAVRGYPQEPAKRGTVVAIIRHIDTEKLQPVTARVTFYFDANGKLNDTEIVRTFNQPIPQPQ